MISFIKMIALARQQRLKLIKNFFKFYQVNKRKKVF